MASPVSSKQVQVRRGKKHKIDFSSPSADDDLSRAIDLVINDRSIAPHLRAVVSCVKEMKEQLSAVIARNKELAEENEKVVARNVELESEVVSLRSQIDVLNHALSKKIPRELFLRMVICLLRIISRT